MNEINTNYKLVYLILNEPEIVAIWLGDDKINLDDIKNAFMYIKDQNLLTKEDYTEKVKYVKETTMLLSDMFMAYSDGMSLDKIKEILTDSLDKTK